MLLQNKNTLLPSQGVWSREQTVLALFWYYQLPFGRLHARNPLIIKWSEIINRNANALAMKLVNFASLDPIIIASGRKGMGNTSARDKEIWEFYNNKLEFFSVHDKFHRILVLSGFFFLKIASTFLNSSFFQNQSNVE